jgi:hypothetical protein
MPAAIAETWRPQRKFYEPPLVISRQSTAILL